MLPANGHGAAASAASSNPAAAAANPSSTSSSSAFLSSTHTNPGGAVATPATTASIVATPQTHAIKRDSATPFDSPAATSATATTSPVTSVRPTSTGSLVGRKRTRDGHSPSESVDGEQSPDGGWNGGAGSNESRIGVKRACNECRQQKLKCNVQQDPFVPCERCKKHKIPCRIDANFKRIGKRKKNAEMEQENSKLHDDLERSNSEVAELRRQLAAAQAQSVFGAAGVVQGRLAMQNGTELKFPVPNRVSAVNDLLGTTDAIDSLLEMRGGSSPAPTARSMYRLHGFSIAPDRVDELFELFFANYHPYLPLMNKDRGPKFFHQACPLLFWSMMATAMRKSTAPELLFHLDPHLQKLLWATISDIKQHYLVVKALATLCTWPLPVTSSNADPTPVLCGVMIQLAKQIGLHRPTHAQDFERFKVEMRDDELRDRYYTWAASNIVAQRVSTGYGLPPNTLYDWVLTKGEGKEPSFTLSPEVNARLQVEIFCDKVTNKLYADPDTPLGFITDDKKREAVKVLDVELEKLMAAMGGSEHSVNRLYMLAGRLHYHLSALFDASTSPDYSGNLDKLWSSTSDFVEAACEVTSPLSGNIITYATSYIFQMVIASGFVLLKLLNSFYAKSIDRDHGRSLFLRVVRIARVISVMSNDLPSRFAEVLSQLWQTSGKGAKPVSDQADGSLQLKVRGRMSMSLVHDSVWRWREISHVEEDAAARDAALNQRTNPDGGATELPSSTVFESARGGGLTVPSSVAMRRSPTPIGMGWGDEFNNDIFDPTSWMFSGNLDFPVNFDSNDIFANPVS